MFCSQCGAEMKPTDAFCNRCGMENRPTAPAQTIRSTMPTAPTPAQPFRSTMPTAPSPAQPFRSTMPTAPNPAQPAANPAPAASYPAGYAASPAPNPAYSAAPAYPTPAPVPGYSPYPAAPAAPAEKKSLKKLFISLGAATLAIILGIVLITCCFGPKAVVRRYLRASSQMNARKQLKLLPKEMLEELEDEADMDYDEFIEYLEDFYEKADEVTKDEYGDNYRITYRIDDMDTIDGKDFRKLKDDYERAYGLDGDKITAAKEVSVTAKIKGSEDSDTEDMDLVVVKYKGKWYVIGALLGL